MANKQTKQTVKLSGWVAVDALGEVRPWTFCPDKSYVTSLIVKDSLACVVPATLTAVLPQRRKGRAK